MRSDLISRVGFAGIGDIEGLCSNISNVLSDPLEVDDDHLRASNQEFHFHIGRALFALGKIDYHLLDNQCENLALGGNRFVLSLPETVERRRFVNRSKDNATSYFDGVRASPGWVGAACSFKFLARRLLDQGFERAMIYEDDAEFSTHTAAQIYDLAGHLEGHCGEWDVFSAFISDLHPEAEIEKTFDLDGLQFVVLDKMVGMVCNIYNKRALEIIADWDELDTDVQTNTIDRYLESQTGLRIVTTIPFLVGHKETLQSSLWGIKNKVMIKMIADSEMQLMDKAWSVMAKRFLASKGGTAPGVS